MTSSDDLSKLVHAIRRHGDDFWGFVTSLSVSERDTLLSALTKEQNLRRYTLYTVKDCRIIEGARPGLPGFGSIYLVAGLLDKDNQEQRIAYKIAEPRPSAKDIEFYGEHYARVHRTFSGETGLEYAVCLLHATQSMTGVEIRRLLHSDFLGTIKEVIGKQLYVKTTPKLLPSGREYQWREYRDTQGRPYHPNVYTNEGVTGQVTLNLPEVS